jgi:hypothetical protein
MNNTETKTDKYCEALRDLEATTLGPALLERAYKVDVATKRIQVQFSKKLDVDLKFKDELNFFTVCDYHGWQIRMEAEE